MNRSDYFWTILGVNWLGLVASKYESDIWLAILFLIGIFVAYGRMKDIGLSYWWLLGLFVPVVNLYPAYCLLFVPTSYFEHNKHIFQNPDTPMNIGQIIFAILFLMLFIFLILQI